MTKVSIKQVTLGLLSLSLIATDAFGNMLPPMPVTQTNVRIRVSQTGAVPVPLPVQPPVGGPVPLPVQPPMGGPVPPCPMPIGPHGGGGVQVGVRAFGGPCGQMGCGPRRGCGFGGHCRVRVRSCVRFGGGCGGGGGVRVGVAVRVGGGRMFGRCGRRC